MSEPKPPTPSKYPFNYRRVLDLLAIVAVTAGLLFLVWKQTHVPNMPTTSASQLPTQVGTPHDFQPLFVHNQLYMTNLFCPGTRDAALSELERICSEVLKDSAGMIMPLVVSAEEKDLLERCRESARITSESATPDTAIYALPLKAGLVGVRFNSTDTLRPTRPSGLRNLRGADETLAPSATPDAALGHRVICYGYVTSLGTSGNTIWIFRPDLHATSLKGSTP